MLQVKSILKRYTYLIKSGSTLQKLTTSHQNKKSVVYKTVYTKNPVGRSAAVSSLLSLYSLFSFLVIIIRNRRITIIIVIIMTIIILDDYHQQQRRKSRRQNRRIRAPLLSLFKIFQFIFFTDEPVDFT